MRFTLVFCLQTIIVTNGFLPIHSEYFTSTGHLTWLLRFEIRLLSELKELVYEQETRINRLKTFHEKHRNFTGSQSVANYIENPISSYKVIKRLVKDWGGVKRSILHRDTLETLLSHKRHLPTARDMNGAKYAILRLQNTFQLSSRQIAEGIVQNASNRTKFFAEDAYDIGLVAYHRQSYGLSSDWMYESLRLLNIGRYSDQDVKLFNSKVLNHLSWSECKDEGNAASDTCVEEMYDKVSRNKGIRGKTKTPKSKFNFETYDEAEETENKRIAREGSLCRGDRDNIPKKYKHKLVCWYKGTNPLLVLKPAKLERIYETPEIIIYRDAITELEMQQIKDIAITKLQRALIRNPITGNGEQADYRVSKSAWISEKDYKVVKKLYTRIEAYTGLRMRTAEPMQIANYGIAGHYETHYDFYGRYKPWNRKVPLRKGNYPGKPEYLYDGERIATMLFYMSNVEIGGATVFTYIGQVVEPSKGDALFWYNLNRDGSGDHRTAHAACPVLIGEKWVSNVWIHEHGQEFRRQCKLRSDEE